jgi:hypothetical protein
MLIHSVYFWLRPDLTEEETAHFRTRVRALTTIPSVRIGHVGTPAETDRPVIDRSYSCMLLTIFDDMAGHDAYQVDPVHDQFRIECAPLWSRVQIYDALT